MTNFQVGDIVTSKVNPKAGKYKIVKCKKTVCWVESCITENIMVGGNWIKNPYIYKNTRYSILRKVKE